MSLATRIAMVKESPTMAMMARAAKMKASGQDVIVLAAGEPDFDTPDHIKAAAIKAIQDGKTKYTQAGGTPELKQAIAAKLARENNLNYEPRQILVSVGAKHSIYNAIQALINPDDEVIIPAPFWVSYPDMVLLAGGKPIAVECTIDDGYKLTATKLRQALSTKTKLLILNSPSNPTGMVYSFEELQDLAKVLLDYPQVYVLTDDIYEHILFGQNTKFVNILNTMPELYERVVVVNGVSKAYAMTGWRIGYAACGDAKLIKAMEIVQSQSTSNPCSISQAAATAALNSGSECVKIMCDSFSIRHDYVVKRLNQIGGIRCLAAEGAFYAFFECSAAINRLYQQGKISSPTDEALSDYLLDNYLVAGVPGSAFGLKDHIRFSYATSQKDLALALDRLENALNS